MNRRLTLLAAGLLGLAAVTASRAQDPSGVVIPMSDLVRRCESCHGPAGVSSRPDIPSLSGKSCAEIMAALNQFYFRERHCPATVPDDAGDDGAAALDMCNISASLSRTEKQELARHFSTGGQLQD